ncbi:hypothetical protein Htur_5055 (plasmid) [Haloterrigena turkmenica DSM 5511]|uniref:Uncharacterized protein n=1 Tax=Haloterrigena turkmenica (strain ATCC 51198 / DSM 5511 / JCM 9101 / NCIMB 13204 / VKM B-1734 / 4k) TaxID=543526 RepID=D2S3J5_HALTV|nr:hypothetical protein [Haloterrigena turkmenica]ADB63942.1 hypothetical protein Htur_5055 [Haloterrigena turkmenica DSM 5511]
MSSDLDQFEQWLRERREGAKSDYENSGPRSSNPRQSDIRLGKSRAYKEVYREFLEWRYEDESGDTGESDDDHPYALAGEGGGIPSQPGCPYGEWENAIMDAVNSDAHTVELVGAADGSAQVEIDGTPMFEGVAYPPQQFTIGGCEEYLSPEGVAKLREVAESERGEVGE